MNKRSLIAIVAGFGIALPALAASGVGTDSTSTQVRGVTGDSTSTQVRGVTTDSTSTQVRGVTGDSTSTQVRGIGTDSTSTQVRGFTIDSTSTQVRGIDTDSTSTQVRGLIGDPTGMFDVVDTASQRIPFAIDAGARDAALVVGADQVGIGTPTPATTLHMQASNTPTMRLDQDGGHGWAAQTWDVGGNERNFFVRNVTGGSVLPLRILPGADQNSVVVDNDSNVHLGAGPGDARLADGTTAALHVYRGGNGAAVLVEDDGRSRRERDMLELRSNGAPQLVLAGGHGAWRVGGGESFRVANADGGAALFEVLPNGDVTVAGTLRTKTTCAQGCDRVFSPDFDLDSIAVHAEKMWAGKALPAVGTTDEDGQFDISHLTGTMLNELEKAHIYIAQLNDRLAEQEVVAQSREAELTLLRDRLAAIESRLGSTTN